MIPPHRLSSVAFAFALLLLSALPARADLVYMNFFIDYSQFGATTGPSGTWLDDHSGLGYNLDTVFVTETEEFHPNGNFIAHGGRWTQTKVTSYLSDGSPYRYEFSYGATGGWFSMDLQLTSKVDGHVVPVSITGKQLNDITFSADRIGGYALPYYAIKMDQAGADALGVPRKGNAFFVLQLDTHEQVSERGIASLSDDPLDIPANGFGYIDMYFVPEPSLLALLPIGLGLLAARRRAWKRPASQ